MPEVGPVRMAVVWCPVREARAFEPVLDAVETLTPRVEVLAPGECAFPARGAARYHGGEAALAAAVVAVVAPHAPAGVGIAEGRFAAGLAARRGGAIVPPGGTPAFLAPLPLRTLGSPDLASLLSRLGIRTLGELAALPRASVAARFGPEGSAAHRLASGLDEHPPVPRRHPPDLRVATGLEPPADRVDVATFAAKTLADELSARLDRLGLACTRLRVEAVTERGETLARVWRHHRRDTVQQVRWQLEGWLAGSGGGALTSLALVPDETVPARGLQLGLWEPPRAPSEAAASALVRVQGLLGAGGVVLARLRGGRDPADRVARGPAGDEPAVDRASPSPWPGRIPPPAPAAVHPQPIPAELLDDAGAAVTVSGRGVLSAPPRRLWVRGGGAWAAVAAWAGPWPLDERWWDRRAARRLARLQVTTSEGAAYLLRVDRGQWWVEATYD